MISVWSQNGVLQIILYFFRVYCYALLFCLQDNPLYVIHLLNCNPNLPSFPFWTFWNEDKKCYSASKLFSGCPGAKNAMNSCLLHPIHHFSEVLWHFSHSNMFYTMKSVLASNADVHILSTIYKHVLKVSRIILQMNQSAFDRLVTFIVPMQFDERSQETQILNA